MHGAKIKIQTCLKRCLINQQYILLLESNI